MIVSSFMFRLRAGVDPDHFGEVDQRFEAEVIAPTPGFIDRTLGNNGQGSWLALTWWSDASAYLADDRPRPPIAAEYEALSDPVSVSGGYFAVDGQGSRSVL